MTQTAENDPPAQLFPGFSVLISNFVIAVSILPLGLFVFSLLGRYFGSVQLLGQSMYGGGYVALLGRIGRLVPMLAVRLHQMRKLASIPVQKLDKHRPLDIHPGLEPEVLVAICSAPISPPRMN